MVSALISWYGLMKPFFISKTGIKVNTENYCWHLRKETAVEKFAKHDEWTFAQDGVPSSPFSLVQYFERIASILTWYKSTWLFLRRHNWKTACSRSWTKEKNRIYLKYLSKLQGTVRKAIKQFVPRMKIVEENQERCIKMLFG